MAKNKYKQPVTETKHNKKENCNLYKEQQPLKQVIEALKTDYHFHEVEEYLGTLFLMTVSCDAITGKERANIADFIIRTKALLRSILADHNPIKTVKESPF
jgi:hypothetical protein